MVAIRKQTLDSVILQILLAMLLIAGMALASMAMSVYVTVNIQDDAEAINLAGSLRMQSYRIANILARADAGEISNINEQLQREREEFSQKLYQSSIEESIRESGNTPLRQSYDRVVENWASDMEPLLTSASAEPGAINWEVLKLQYQQHLVSQVDDIDRMVTYLQRNTEGKIELLGMAEGTSILLIIFTMIFFIMKADSNFVAPLKDLVLAAEKAKSGDLSYRTSYTGNNELGLLSQTFNDMTDNLQVHYQTLEDQVTERTRALRKSNHALYFLYKTSREIASTPYDQQLLNVFLADLKKLVDVDLINLCVNPEPNYPDYDLITTVDDEQSLCFGDCDNCDLVPRKSTKGTDGTLSLPLKNREDVFGFMHIRIAPDSKLEPWQHQLLETVAETLSTAFAFYHTLGQERRLILHEERSTIARELHDSLAQSLSYMKLETARLKKMIERDFERARIESALTDIQEGLNAAYKHLRELLVTFRVKLDAPNLRSALGQTVEEFASQTQASVTLEYDLGSYAMGPNEDIHILHILREALTNAIKHARADNIVLRCTRNEEGDAVFSVEDDGVGMPDNPEKQHHYGIYTMRERAQRLDGVLICTRRVSGGTRVRLQLKSSPQLLHA